MNRISFLFLLITLSLQSCLKQDTVTPQQQFKSDTTSISTFLKNSGTQATKVSSGIWYSIDSLTNGVLPALSDSVTMSYVAKLIPTLQEVDKTPSKPVTVLLSASIAGMQQGLILFPVGSYGQVYMPSGLAFGTSSHNNNQIPPNANLVYDVKVVSVKGTRLAADVATIQSYLQTNSITASPDESGIQYIISQTSSSTPKPGPNDFVTVTYTEQILNADSLLTTVSTPVKLALNSQVTCWRIMLPKYVAEGSQITMYVPSGYAYGSSSSKTVPANSNFIYVVTLIKVN